MPVLGGLKQLAFAVGVCGLAACSSGGNGGSGEPATPPRLLGGSTAKVEERTEQVVYTAEVEGGKRDDWIFSLEGEHANLHNIDASTGEIRFSAAPRYNNSEPAANDYRATIVVKDSHGNEDRADIGIRVLNDYRVAFVVPASNANVAMGSEDTLPVILRVYEEDGGQSKFEAVVSVNGQQQRCSFKVLSPD